VTLVKGAIASTVIVRIERAELPKLPLPAGVRAVSGAYRISASEEVPTSEPFILAIPVPESADPAKLTLLVYDPGGTPHVPRRMWFRLAGIHDGSLGVFLAPLASIPEEGLIFVLASDDRTEWPAPDAGALVPSGGLGERWLPGARAIVTPKGAFTSW